MLEAPSGNAGAGGNLAVERTAKSPPDGYTLAMGGNAALVINPNLMDKLGYDPLKDYSYITQVFIVPNILVVPPDVPAKTIQELVALAKSKPDYFVAGHAGVGTSQHLGGELFMAMTGVKMTHVPFRGNGPSSAALLGGQIDLIIDGLAPQLGNIAEHRVRVLGVTTKERTPFLPDAPAVSETLPGYQFPMWVGLFAPAKTPRDIVARMSAEIAKAVRDPATKQRYTEVKVDAVGSTPEEFDKFFREQLKFNEDIIKSANIQQQD